MANRVVRVTPCVCIPSFCFRKFVLILISPAGSFPEYFEKINSNDVIQHLLFISASLFSATEFPIALITPMPVTQILLMVG